MQITQLTQKSIIKLSKYKNEPKWVLDFRLKSLQAFLAKPFPNWGPNLKNLQKQFKQNKIIFFNDVAPKPWNKWEDIPDKLKRFFESIKIPEAEKKFLTGVELQYDSSTIYSTLKTYLKNQGVIFTDIDTAIQSYPNLVQEYFASVVDFDDNKFASLNGAVFSGGSFLYVPKNVKLSLPLHAFFYINHPGLAQFERSLIIIEQGSVAEYLEGCTAPLFSKNNLHSAVVEVIVKQNARFKYTTLQNWSPNVYNLTTQRAVVEQNAHMEWFDVNVGSKVTMKYPACILKGKNSTASTYSIGFAKNNQIQDTGAKMIHLAPNTKSQIISKAISLKNGINQYRGICKITQPASKSSGTISCDSLLLHKTGKAGTLPVNIVQNKTSTLKHEAKITALDDLSLSYLQTRGISEKDATNLITLGFLQALSQHLPLEFAREFNALIKLALD